MKNIKKIIISSLIFAFILSSTYVFARKIGEFSNFRIVYSWGDTGYLTKEYNGSSSKYVLNLYPSEDLAPINIMNVLANYNNNERSTRNLTRCGKREEYSNWASKGYDYKLRMSRENFWDGAIAITGSWSPDN
ncbi:hypothetical protein ABGF48_00895 [Helcococcus bovis]|uniref:hypothetical protein n=1 Tax=Helcococcus bovis TaxID=3153252 RepID=UPI0038B72F46